jgi:hypothetical protein
MVFMGSFLSFKLMFMVYESHLPRQRRGGALIKPMTSGLPPARASQGTEVLRTFLGAPRLFAALEKEKGFAFALANARFAKRRGGAKTRSGQFPS